MARSRQRSIDTQQQAISFLEAAGWRLARTTRKGYALMMCTCGGKHFSNLPKTPSNPNTYNNKCNYLVGLCKTHLSDMETVNPD